MLRDLQQDRQNTIRPFNRVAHALKRVGNFMHSSCQSLYQDGCHTFVLYVHKEVVALCVTCASSLA